MQDIIAMIISTVLGMAVGIERQLGHKPAGLRTHTLVCLGSTMFVLLTVHTADIIGRSNLDPTRLIHGVITGVGFLCAGSIMRQGTAVHGLTTAAGIWIVAAIGSAVGVHDYPLAIAGTALALIVLRGFQFLDRLFPAKEENGH